MSEAETKVKRKKKTRKTKVCVIFLDKNNRGTHVPAYKVTLIALQNPDDPQNIYSMISIKHYLQHPPLRKRERETDRQTDRQIDRDREKELKW